MSADRLITAVKVGDVETVRRLLSEDPSLARARDGSGASALMVALYHGRTEAARLLADANPERDIFEAAALGDARRVESLLVRDPSLARATAGDGFAALGLAAFFGHHEAVRVLLARGADVNFVTPGNGYTALTAAVNRGDAAVVRTLLDHGANPRHRYGGGYSPLHQAAASGNAETVELLLGRGGAAGARMDDGRTPADLAREKGHDDVAARLESKSPS
jgi:ankyrin repeat protein